MTFDHPAFQQYLQESGTFDFVMGLNDADKKVFFAALEQRAKQARADALREACQAVESAGTGRPGVAKALRAVMLLRDR